MLKNKVALVTGASSGIGRAVALAWAREGAKVVVSDVNVAGGEETAALVRAQGGDALFVAADVGKPADGEALVAQTLARYGRLDVACNNAGIGGPQARHRRLPAGRLGPGHQHQPVGRVLRHEVPDPGHAQKRRRQHHQHGLHPRRGRLCQRRRPTPPPNTACWA